MDGSNQYTLNIASKTSVLYSPTGDLVSSGGTCLVPTIHNLAKYHVVIGLLIEFVTNDVRHIRVYQDLDLVIH